MSSGAPGRRPSGGTARRRVAVAGVGAAATPSLQTIGQVERAVVACGLCPRLRRHCERVARERKAEFRESAYWGKPVPGFGDSGARLLVVGLAPAAHGGNRTGRMFTGDSSGSWLYRALHRTGFANQPDSTGRGDSLRLAGCYVTAAARCAPPANRPTRQELDLCRRYLEAEIRLLGTVRVVVGLGRIGHEAWLRASGWWRRLPPDRRPPFRHGAEARLPDGTILLSSYHPSRQNTNTGRLTWPMWIAVFRRARARVGGRVASRPTSGAARRPRSATARVTGDPETP